MPFGQEGQMRRGCHHTVSLQSTSTTHFAMLKGVAGDRVQTIAVRQLGVAQGLKLCRRGMQFEFGGEHLFHASSITSVHALCQDGMASEDFHPAQTPKKE